MMFDSHFVCSNCSPLAFVHLFSHSVKLSHYVDWFMWQAVADHLQHFFEFGDSFGFWMELVIGLQHRAPDMVVNGSGASGGH